MGIYGCILLTYFIPIIKFTIHTTPSLCAMRFAKNMGIYGYI